MTTVIHRLINFVRSSTRKTACGKPAYYGLSYSRYLKKVTCKKCLKAKLVFTAALFFLVRPAFSMGARPPSDPATWGDVQSVQSQVNSNYAQEQADVNSLSNRLDDINALKIQIGTTVRIFDAKHMSLNFFSFTDIQGTGGNAVGLNVGFKLGKSYEERLLEKQQKQIDYLLSKLNRN